MYVQGVGDGVGGLHGPKAAKGKWTEQRWFLLACWSTILGTRDGEGARGEIREYYCGRRQVASMWQLSAGGPWATGELIEPYATPGQRLRQWCMLTATELWQQAKTRQLAASKMQIIPGPVLTACCCTS
jgi:hypothetical protein